jgi:hypothetical protein
MIAEVTPQLWWYVARASGLTAYALATSSVLLGLAFSARAVRRRGAPAWMNDLHRFLGFLTVVFTAVHLLGLWADSYVHFGPSELFVPMASTWNPGAVAWGVVAAYLLVAIELTSWARRWLSRRLWHTVHLSSIGLFALATVHAVQAGTDTGTVALAWTFVGSVLLVGFLVMYRVLTRRFPTMRPAERPAELVEAA